MIEVQRGRNVITALVPEVGKVQEGEMAEGDASKEEGEEDRPRKTDEPRERSTQAIGGKLHVS